MRMIILVSVLVAGCSKEQPVPTVVEPAKAVETKAEAKKRGYTVKELYAAKELPKHSIILYGRVTQRDTKVNQDGTLWIELSDREKSVQRNTDAVMIRFDPGEKGFSQDLLKWFAKIHDDAYVTLEVTVTRPDPQDRIMGVCSSIH